MSLPAMLTDQTELLGPLLARGTIDSPCAADFRAAVCSDPKCKCGNPQLHIV
jgi:hypothetical protein